MMLKGIFMSVIGAETSPEHQRGREEKNSNGSAEQNINDSAWCVIGEIIWEYRVLRKPFPMLLETGSDGWADRFDLWHKSLQPCCPY